MRFEERCGSLEGRFGLGYYSGDDVLLVRRPVYQYGSVEGLLSRAVSNHFIVSVEKRPSSVFKIESTPPFRYRNFLGVLSASEQLPEGFVSKVMSELPAFLRRDMKSESDAELLFYLFLSCLYDMGRLQSEGLRINFIMEALRTTLALEERFLGGKGAQALKICGCVTNGEHMVAGTIGFPLQVLTLGGLDPCPRCSDQRKTPWMDERRVSHPHCSIVSFVNTEETLDGFVRVRDRDVVGVDPQGEIVSIEV
jgi:hypothetical protein